MGQGNIFIGVCQEFCSQGCLLPGGAWSRGGVCSGGGTGPRGVYGGDPPDGYCCGRYASYWNAFLSQFYGQEFFEGIEKVIQYWSNPEIIDLTDLSKQFYRVDLLGHVTANVKLSTSSIVENMVGRFFKID